MEWWKWKDNAKRVEKMMQLLLKVCVVLMLVSQSSTLSGLYGNVLVPLFDNSFYVFLLLNAIILFLLALSNTTHSPTDTRRSCCRKQRRMVAPEEFKRPLEGRLRSMEQLSQEDFNRAVEDFIAMHKKMQWQEQIILYKTN